MISISLAFVCSLLVAAFSVPFIRRKAVAWGAVDRPERARRVHTRVTPRLGGLAIALGFFLSLTMLLLLETQVARIFSEDINRVLALAIGGLMMLGLGVYDDIHGADARLKLAVQIPAALLLCALDFTFTDIALPWGGSIHVGAFGYVLTVIWVVGVTNAINLIDGLDGLAAGVALFSVTTMCVMAVFNGHIVMGLVTAALAGALSGFLFHNFHPATIFMGDAGSLFIGFLVAAVSLMTNTKSSTTVALLIPVLTLGLPLIDTTLAAFRRMLRGKSPFSADMDHMHHRLLKMGLTHRRAVLALWSFCLLACLSAMGVVFTYGRLSVYILGGFTVVALLFARRLGYIRYETWATQYHEGREERQRRRGVRDRVQAVTSSIQAAEDVDELFSLLDRIHQLHNYDEVRLELYGPEGPEVHKASALTPVPEGIDPTVNRRLEWSRSATPRPAAHSEQTLPGVPGQARATSSEQGLEITFDLRSPQGRLGRISYRYNDGRTQLKPEEESIMEQIHAALARRLGKSFQVSTTRRRLG
ncbi:MAG: glycosyltransferase family 4 protein [Bradymonadia bacterium]